MHKSLSRFVLGLLSCASMASCAEIPTSDSHPGTVLNLPPNSTITITNSAPNIPATSSTNIAYAHVLPDGTLDTANSKNVLSFLGGTTGLYCFKIAFTPKNAVGNLAFDATAPNQGAGFIKLAVPPTTAFGCSLPGANAFVGTFNSSRSVGGWGFYVLWTA